MKNILIIACASFIALPSFSQEAKKEIRKEVNVEVINDVKTVMITTNENGKITKETYTGAEADKKLAELDKEAKEMNEKAKADPSKKVVIEKSQSSSTKTSTNTRSKGEQEVAKEIKVEEKNGVKTLTIKTIENGKESIEVFEGQAAEAKMKELEADRKKNESKSVIINKSMEH